MLKQGDKALEFSLKDKDGKLHGLKNIKSNFIIVYFYPKDNTPGCTIEAKEFSDLKKEFDKINCEIIGISGGDKKSKEKFVKSCKKYKVYGEKSFMGKKFLGIKRTTFILDKNKKIIKIYGNVKVFNHGKEVLEFVKSK